MDPGKAMPLPVIVPSRSIINAFFMIQSSNNFLYHVLFISSIFSTAVQAISPNVPAVCDGLAARIRKCAAFLGLAKCGWKEAWEWSEAE
jgi:hypothetical protein